ncbi:MAG: SAM-dependent methyltransferase [Acetatifactor sp.]|nr:SAM-dependent methyltransferase [Acetatifactor sp.]
MKEIQDLFRQTLNRELIQMTLSGTVDPVRAEKVKVRPVMIRDELLFQETLYRGTQVFHTNFGWSEMADRLEGYMGSLFQQAQINSAILEATALVSRKGKVTIRRKQKQSAQKQDRPAADLAHDRSRQYILKEGKPVDFLVSLGVQTPDGRIAKAKYAKFRQINRYLEFIEDILDKLPKERTIRIIDFGCGKSYLTFAMYYYLHTLQGRDIKVTGLDLKEDVIQHCNALAQKLGYDELHFEQGDISGYQGSDKVDMVVSLHACDKATDYALEKAVKWGAEVILAVPCCQHELNGQIHCDTLQPILKYGVIKERMAALITDALRADLLEQQGYDTQILEFIDMEHTPKNLMIRAVKGKGMRPRTASIDGVTEFLQVKPVLKELL